MKWFYPSAIVNPSSKGIEKRQKEVIAWYDREYAIKKDGILIETEQGDFYDTWTYEVGDKTYRIVYRNDYDIPSYIEEVEEEYRMSVDELAGANKILEKLKGDATINKDSEWVKKIGEVQDIIFELI